MTIYKNLVLAINAIKTYDSSRQVYLDHSIVFHSAIVSNKLVLLSRFHSMLQFV